MSLNEKMTALADAVRSKANRSDTLTIDAMTAAVNGLVVGTPSTKSLTVTPTKSAQTFSSSDLGVNTYYSTVTVNAIPANYIDTSDATAVSSDILYGKTAYINGWKVEGNMTDYGDVEEQFPNTKDTLSIGANGYFKTIKVTLNRKELEVTPSDRTQTFNAISDGINTFYTKVIVNGDANLKPENIAKDVTIFGVKGAYKGTDTSDATVTAADLLYGVTAYGANGKVTGMIPTITATLDANVVTVPKGYIAEAQTLTVPEMPEVSVHLNGVSIPPGYNPEIQSITVGNAIEGGTVTPGSSDIVVSKKSYLVNDLIIKGDAGLIADNIKSGVSIFDVEGTFTSDANATAEDIAKDKTAYVNGEKITGTHTCGGVSRLYTSAGGGPLNRLYTELSPEFSDGPMQTPARRGAYNDIHASNNSLWYARNGESGEYRYRSRKLPLSEGWTLCRDNIAVREGKLHAINADASNDDFSFTLFPDSPANITQLGFSYDSRRWCLDDSGHAIIFSPHGEECKPAILSDIHVSKLLNQKLGGGGGHQFSQAAISSSGRAILLWADPQDAQPQTPHFEYVGNDISFVNYYYHEYESYGWGGGAYRLALTADGTLYAQNASSMENSWEAVPDAPKFRTGNFLGFCELGVSEDWETGEMRPYDNNVALHIAQDGTLWKIRATGDSSGSLTGVVTEQIDSRTQWNYVPPELGRDSKSYAQCGSTLYIIKSDGADSINISWEECYIQPSGKLIATSHDDSFLWFERNSAVIDVTGLGEI